MTKNERDLLVAIYLSEFNDGSHTAPVWVNCLWEFEGSRSFGGVMASLTKKGLAETDGECAWLTKAGVEKVESEKLTEKTNVATDEGDGRSNSNNGLTAKKGATMKTKSQTTSGNLYSIEKIKAAHYILFTRDGVERFRSNKQAEARRDSLKKAEAALVREAEEREAKKTATKAEPKPKANGKPKKAETVLTVGPKAADVDPETVRGHVLAYVRTAKTITRGELVDAVVEEYVRPSEENVTQGYVQGYVASLLRIGALAVAK